MALFNGPPDLLCYPGLPINGRSYFPCAALRVGEVLSLRRIYDNDYDPNAIAICRGNAQVGWVPMSKTSALAPKLEEWGGGYFRVTGRSALKHTEMGDLYLSKEHSPPASKPAPRSVTTPLYYRVEALYEPGSSGTTARRIDLRQYVGDAVRLQTSPTRTSITCRRFDGEPVCWFRKDEHLYENSNYTLGLVIDPSSLQLFEAPEDLKKSRDRIFGPDFKSPWKLQQEARDGQQQTETPNQPTTETQKENTMNFSNLTTNFIATNKSAAVQAGYMEAGRLANNQMAQFAGKHLPFMVRGYADTPVGKLVIANIAIMAAAQLRPNDATLNKLTNAMAVQAFQALYQEVDIEGMLNSLLASPGMKEAIDRLPKDEFAVPTAPGAPRPV